MSTTWPSNFPAPLIKAYSYKNTSALIRINMEGGPPRQRRQFTQVPTRFNVSFIMSADIYEIFRAYFKHILKDGQDYFSIPLDVENGASTEQARFIEPYRAKKISHNKWRIDSALEMAVSDTGVSSEMITAMVEIGITLEQMESLSDSGDTLLQLMANQTAT